MGNISVIPIKIIEPTVADLGSVFILGLFDHFPSHLERAIGDSEPSKGETVAPCYDR